MILRAILILIPLMFIGCSNTAITADPDKERAEIKDTTLIEPPPPYTAPITSPKANESGRIYYGANSDSVTPLDGAYEPGPYRNYNEYQLRIQREGYGYGSGIGTSGVFTGLNEEDPDA
jgi:hypothetical protein